MKQETHGHTDRQTDRQRHGSNITKQWVNLKQVSCRELGTRNIFGKMTHLLEVEGVV